jgi:hypothetical protein
MNCVTQAPSQPDRLSDPRRPLPRGQRATAWGF